MRLYESCEARNTIRSIASPMPRSLISTALCCRSGKVRDQASRDHDGPALEHTRCVFASQRLGSRNFLPVRSTGCKIGRFLRSARLSNHRTATRDKTFQDIAKRHGVMAVLGAHPFFPRRERNFPSGMTANRAVLLPTHPKTHLT